MHIIHLTTRSTKKKVRVFVEQILSYMPVDLSGAAKGTDVSMATGVSISVTESAEDIDDMLIRHGVLMLDDDVEAKSEVSFQFGKYRGRTIEAVLREDPQYIAWVYQNVDNRGGVTDAQYLRSGGTLPKPLPQPVVRTSPRSAPAARGFSDDFADDDIPF